MRVFAFDKKKSLRLNNSIYKTEKTSIKTKYCCHNFRSCIRNEVYILLNIYLEGLKKLY